MQHLLLANDRSCFFFKFLQETKSSRRSLEQLLLSLLARTNYTGLSVPGVVQDFLRLESNIKRVRDKDMLKDE